MTADFLLEIWGKKSGKISFKLKWKKTPQNFQSKIPNPLRIYFQNEGEDYLQHIKAERIQYHPTDSARNVEGNPSGRRKSYSDKNKIPGCIGTGEIGVGGKKALLRDIKSLRIPDIYYFDCECGKWTLTVGFSHLQLERPHQLGRPSPNPTK